MAVRKSPRWSPQEATGMRRRGNGRKRTSTWRVVSTNVRGKFSGASHSSQLQGSKGVINKGPAELIHHGEKGAPILKFVIKNLVPKVSGTGKGEM